MISFIICANSKWGDFATPFIDSIYNWHSVWAGIEIILVDNGSPVPYQIGPRYKVVRLDPDEDYNYMMALNAGVREKATGDWLVFCNDDILCTGPFVDKIHFLTENSLYGNEIRQKTKAWGLEFRYIYGWMLIMHRTLWDTVGHFDEYYLHAGMDDLDYSWRAQKAGYTLRRLELPFIHLANLPGAIHRRHTVPHYEENMSRSKAHFLEKVKNAPP